jgi:Leucine-rich repeat (LRR) protein
LNEVGLSKVPRGLFYLSNLRTLSLRHNNLSEIPEQLYSLKNLRTLNISRNPRITAISSRIKDLKQLRSLNIVGCSINTLPLEILQMKNLIQFFVESDKIDKYMIDEIVKQMALEQRPHSNSTLPKLRFLGICPNYDIYQS